MSIYKREAKDFLKKTDNIVEMALNIEELLEQLTNNNGSDLHIKVGNHPFIRIDGQLHPLENYPVLRPENTAELANSIMDDGKKEKYKKNNEVDFAISTKNGRFRVNIFKQRGSSGLVIRCVSFEKKSFDDLNLPDVLKDLANLPRGLILLTGIAGCGKTTTISAMIHHINCNKSKHIITVEDPIEILHSDIKSIINQRELGIDTDNYNQSLKHIVRQDPDVIFVGEIRDKETMDSAMKATELGNLVFSTLHTVNATETINRIIDLYPLEHQKQIRILLAANLMAVISLRLLPRVGGGRIPAIEIMRTTDTIRQYILKPDETKLIKEAIENGGYYGMRTFDQSLLELLKTNSITKEDAMTATENEHNFELFLAKNL